MLPDSEENGILRHILLKKSLMITNVTYEIFLLHLLCMAVLTSEVQKKLKSIPFFITACNFLFFATSDLQHSFTKLADCYTVSLSLFDPTIAKVSRGA